MNPQPRMAASKFLPTQPGRKLVPYAPNPVLLGSIS